MVGIVEGWFETTSISLHWFVFVQCIGCGHVHGIVQVFALRVVKSIVIVVLVEGERGGRREREGGGR